MSLSSFSTPAIMAGGGIEAVESRMKQIEGLIRNVQVRKAAEVQSQPSSLPVDPLDKTSEPKPFQFYLKQAGEAPVSQTAIMPSLPTSAKERAQAFQPLIEGLSQKHGVDKNLINAVIQQESGFNPAAVSRAGATGLMQLMPGTAQGLGVHNAKDPAQNLEGGIRYLKGLLEQFNGNIPLALAAYNAGPGAVTKHKGIPPYKETQNYVRNILAMYLQSRQG